MHDITAGELRSVLHYRMLIERLRQAFRGRCNEPARCRYPVATYGQTDATLTLEAAWHPGRAIGVKIATEFPDNIHRDLPKRSGHYVLLDGKTGILQAVLDDAALTTRRTAAAAALGASYLARADAARLLVIGTGALAPNLIEAYAVVRPIRQVLVWGRDRMKAEKVSARFRRVPFTVAATDDLEGAVRGAHIIACATAATHPLLQGAWLEPGTHIDLIGSTTPEAREADDDVMRHGRVFVDTLDRAPHEGGDVVQSLRAGTLTFDDLAGDLYDLAQGKRAGRRFYDQVTVLKAVGCALEDLTAAELAVEMVIHNKTLR